MVDGPEVDGIYAVFHDLEEEEQGTSSEEKVEPSIADEQEIMNMTIDDEF